MTQRLRLALPLLGALATLIGLPAATEAQSCSLSATLIKIGDQEISQTNLRPVSAAECEAGTTVTYRILTTGLTQNTMDLYLGKGDICSLGDERQKVGNTCTFVNTTKIVQGQQQQEFSVELNDTICGTGEAETFVTLWFLATNTSQGTQDEATCAAPRLDVDTLPPSAPSGLNSPSGERSLDLTWSPVTDNEINRYVVYIDQEPDEDCGSSVLMAGEVVGDLPDGIVTQTAQGASARSSTITASKIPNGDAAVAVAAQDLAGNIGPLSALSCARVMPTSGFWDVYQSKGGEAGASGSCSSLGSSPAGILSPALFTLFGLRLRSRRRTS